jgi:hypothetical protein
MPLGGHGEFTSQGLHKFYEREWHGFLDVPVISSPALLGVGSTYKWEPTGASIAFPADLSDPDQFEFRLLTLDVNVRTASDGYLMLQWGTRDGSTDIPADQTENVVWGSTAAIWPTGVAQFHWPAPGLRFGPGNLIYACAKEANTFLAWAHGVIVPRLSGKLD